MYPTNYFRYEGDKLRQWWTTRHAVRELTPPEQCETGEWRDVQASGHQNPLPGALAAAATVHGTLPMPEDGTPTPTAEELADKHDDPFALDQPAKDHAASGGETTQARSSRRR